MKKNILKGILTAAMVAALMIGGSRIDAKAMTLEEFSQLTGLPVEVIMSDPGAAAMYENLKNEDASAWLYAAQAAAAPVAATVGVPVSHPEMLALVNTDRAANGAGSLVWNADLEVIAQQRAVETMANYQSPEYAAAKAAGTSTGAIAHRGMRAGTSENALRASSSFGHTLADNANTSWINSAGHHRNRIKAGWTQYAAASYIDPVTGQETCVEVFADNNFIGSSTFDSARYAADYPDLAAAFGNDRNALYNHYLTNGIKEGRKVYNTDGTVFGK